MSKKSFSWIDLIPVTFVTLLFISQIIVGIYLLSDVTQIEFLAYVGVALYALSGIIFGMLPIIEFRKKGRVEKGKSYIHTTTLVDTGIYSIVRHPQFVTFILWAFAGMLLFQHWIIVLLGIPIIPLTYFDLIRADKGSIEKFGDDYKAYMKKVPRANFLLGFIRHLRQRKMNIKQDDG
ncbi:MAG: methyltransferase family protein [Candidatus Hodarchaeota archaeon]